MERKEELERLDKETNDLLFSNVFSLSYYKNTEIYAIIQEYQYVFTNNLEQETGINGFYSAKDNSIYLDPKCLSKHLLLHEKMHMISASLKDQCLGYQDNRTKESFAFFNYLNESATEWLTCRVLHGENFLFDPESKIMLSYLPGVVAFQKYVNQFGEQRMLEHYFDHSPRKFWDALSTEEKMNLFTDFEEARKKDVGLKKEKGEKGK